MTPTAFETGKTYATRSACDHDCVFRFTMLRRTPKTITFTSQGREQTRGVKVIDGIETCYPFGRYSMAPVLGADDVEVTT